MQRYYLLTAGVVACFSSVITWYLVDPQSFVLYTNKHLQRQLVSSSSSSSNASKTTFCFYKFSLQWPPSTCTTEMPPDGRGLDCRGRVPAKFTIHGLWPQVSKHKSCTKLKPKTEIIRDLQPIEKDLEQLWPNLKNSESEKENQDFWKYEWKEHGMYSDYPQKPFDYFNSSLMLRKSFHPDPAFNLTPGATYTVKQVADKIRVEVGAKPEIACSKSRVEKNTLLLWEVRLCYQKQTYTEPGVVQDCKNDFAGDCKNLEDSIKIPNPPQYSSSE